MTAIKRLARVRYGLGQPPKLSLDGVPIIRATNIFRGSITSKGLIYAALEDLPLDRAPLLKAGEVLVVRSGAYTGDSALVTKEWEGSAPGYDLRLTPESIEPRFLAYCMLSKPVGHQIDIAKSRAAQPHLNAEELGEVVIPTLSTSEQWRTADFLDAETTRLQRLIDVQVRARTQLLERRVVAVHGFVTGSRYVDRRASSLAWADSVPADWPVIKLSYLARMGSGHTPSRSRAEWWVHCNIPWITTGEVQQVRDDRREVIMKTREKISELGMENSAAELHPEGTVVLCRTASAGYSAVMGSDMATSQDFVTWTCGPWLDPFYLLWSLRAMRPDLLGRLAMGSTHKTIYVPDLQMLRILVPSMEEQRNIVNHIRVTNQSTDAALDAIDKQLELLAERRQALITAAVTGRIDVATARGCVG